jgi:hypothetical protein
MSDSYDVLAADGSVLQYRADQFSEFTEARSREQHDKLVADGWLALDERIETGEMPEHPTALEEAFTEHVVPPEPAPHITVFILGRLKPGEEGSKVV